MHAVYRVGWVSLVKAVIFHSCLSQNFFKFLKHHSAIASMFILFVITVINKILKVFIILIKCKLCVTNPFFKISLLFFFHYVHNNKNANINGISQ